MLLGYRSLESSTLSYGLCCRAKSVAHTQLTGDFGKAVKYLWPQWLHLQGEADAGPQDLMT